MTVPALLRGALLVVLAAALALSALWRPPPPAEAPRVLRLGPGSAGAPPDSLLLMVPAPGAVVREAADPPTGGGASFASGRLPAAPSSVTFTVHSQLGTDNSPSAFVSQRMGVGWFDGTSGALPATRWMFLSFSAT